MKIVVFDLETGGVQPHQPDIQIAAAAIEIVDANTVFVEEVLDCCINFDPSLCDPEALKLNSCDPLRWDSEGVSEEYALKRFIALCKANAHLTLKAKATGNPYNVAMLGGHNVTTFDIPRLQAMGARHGDPFLGCCWWYPLDTYQGVLWWLARHPDEPRPMNYQLETLSKYFDLPKPTHDAMSDIRTTGYLMAKLLHA